MKYCYKVWETNNPQRFKYFWLNEKQFREYTAYTDQAEWEWKRIPFYKTFEFWIYISFGLSAVLFLLSGASV